MLRLHPDSHYGKAIVRLQFQYNLVFAFVLLVFLAIYLPGYGKPQAALLAETPEAVHLIILSILLGCILWGLFFSKPARREGGTLEEKFALYRQHAQGRFLFLGAVLLLPSLGIWLSNAPWYAAVFAIAIILFAALRPSAYQFSRDMRLSKAEVSQLKEENKTAAS